MSLFKIRDFWSVHSEDDEYFDQNSLIVTKLNTESDFVVTGSQSGVLRIFKPSSEINEDGTVSSYKHSDLFLEKIIDVPILSVSCGKLVSGSQQLQLAILHPRLISVYSLSTKEGSTDHGTQNYLQLMYEHDLRKSAANFVIGPFGGSQNREFICVQSLDGMLSFFEQENHSFDCILPDFLLPGPLAYCKLSDSFLTSTCNWTIESFNFKTLSETGDKAEDTRSKLQPSWSYKMGEPSLDIKVLEDFKTKESFILILGERNLFCLKETGKIKFMKRLDFSPICFKCFILEENIMSLVVSETSTLLIYQNTSLKWSAKLQFSPVAIERAFLKHIRGVIVLLSEEGRLECCYLGTHPSLFVAPPINYKEIDFEKAEAEMATLNKIIRSSYGTDMSIKNTSAQRELSLNIVINPHLEPCSFETNVKSVNQQMCSFTVDILPQAVFEEVQVAMYVQKPLKVVPEVAFFENISSRTTVTCNAFLCQDQDVPSLELKVIASFISNLGVPRSVSKRALLPAKLVLEACAAQKESEHKVTININQAPVILANLFPEFVGENGFSQSSNAVGFRGSATVSILLAKSSERYRIQSDSFASLNLLIEQIIHRLKKYYSSKSDFGITFNSALPANELLRFVNEHFTIRQNVNSLQHNLNQLSTQFRIIQKRLIAKFKAKNPMPLTNLELLLEDTYNEVIQVTDQLDTELEKLNQIQISLACAVSLINTLTGLLDIHNGLKELVQATFCPNVFDLETQNWEDVMDASLCFLLRTSLAKSDKDKLRAAHTSFEEIKDIGKMERHLTQVMERVPKKGAKKELIDSEDEEERKEEPEETKSLPIGSQFGESSTRLLSARKSLLRRRQITSPETEPNESDR